MIKYTICKTALSKSRLPGLDYTFNPYIGCYHGCLYCYVPDVLKLNLEWGKEVYVKKNVLNILRKEVLIKKRGIVGISTATDPYQSIEKDLEITRRAIEILKNSGFYISIQTKSSLVLRDLDLMNEKFDVGFTITSINEEFRKKFEPNAPSINERISALEEISSKGIKTWIFYGPVIPGFNDSEEDMKNIVILAAKTNSKIIYDKLNIKPKVMKRMQNLNFKNVDFKKLELLCKKFNVKCEPAFKVK
ncbi:MAG: radical SAM protein [Candidatus Methanomethylicaceae archaeon]|nr:radical SAM protein [Candidatus Verstraetearchaeota archaeon]